MWKAEGGFDLDDLDINTLDEARSAEIAQASKALFTTLATARDDAPVHKIGRRNSAKDQAAIQASHDQMAALGARCDPDNCDLGEDDDEEEDDVPASSAPDAADPAADQKSAAIAELAKAWTELRTEKDALKARLDGVAPELLALRADIELLKAHPLPPKTAGSVLAVVDKSTDARGAPAEPQAELSLDDVQKVLEAMAPRARADLLMKAAMARPIPIRA
jgi:hypothetical protein